MKVKNPEDLLLFASVAFFIGTLAFLVSILFMLLGTEDYVFLISMAGIHLSTGSLCFLQYRRMKEKRKFLEYRKMKHEKK